MGDDLETIPCTGVGFFINVPCDTATEVGRQLLNDRAKREEWAAELERLARQVRPEARAVLQPESRDSWGFLRVDVALWCDEEGLDRDAMINHLEGYFVTHVTYYYTPPMA